MADPPGASGDGGRAQAHGRSLLEALGVKGEVAPAATHPALAWRRAGLMEVTGRPDGPGLVPPVPLASAADGALAALRAMAPSALLPKSGAALLGERARLLRLTRAGRISPNGTCRLVDARGGRFALSLARPEDWDVLPALLEDAGACGWEPLERVAAKRDRDTLVARGRLLGLPIAPDEPPHAPATPFSIAEIGSPRLQTGVPLVVDLSSLWAGPLAASLLAGAGARVIKVESRRRPDGARAGDPRFFDLLNGGKLSVAFDFADPADLARLRTLLAKADIVIEGSRPRALAQLGIDATAVVRAGATWVTITGHGRDGGAAEWVGFGDDAAVAGGLSAAMASAWGEPMFVGDAIADPLTGITAALAAWAGWLRGGGVLIDVPLARVVAHACRSRAAGRSEVMAWQRLALADQAALNPLRQSERKARALGADNPLLADLLR